LETSCVRSQRKKDKEHCNIIHLIFSLKEKGKMQLCNKTFNLKVAVKIRYGRPITMVSWS